MNKLARQVTVSALALACGCAHYEPAPIDPDRALAELRTRSLADANVRRFIEANRGQPLERWPPTAWDLELLTLAAFYYHPDLDVARASWDVMKAGVVTAGARPNPGFDFDASHVVDEAAGVRPWIVQPTFGFSLETKGKRGYRVEEARQRAESARLELAAAAWDVRSRVRGALAATVLARDEAELLAAEDRLRSERARLFESAAGLGDLPPALASAARIEANNARRRRVEADGRAAQALDALGSSIGVPSSALDAIGLAFPALDALPAPSVLVESEARNALLGRADVRRALVDYAAAEAALRLEIARQYPDVNLRPGYRWRETERRLPLGIGFDLPMFDRNEGPIAEALAERELAAARFRGVQAAALANFETSLDGYAAARTSFDVAAETLTAAEARERDAEQAFALGDANAITVIDARLEAVIARRDRLAALANAQAALVALESALERPLGGVAPLPPVPEASPRPQAPPQ